MNSFLEQIQSILAGDFAEYNWLTKNLGAHRLLSDLTYEDAFQITSDDVYDYVVKNGWDHRTVKEVGSLPPDSEAGSIFYIFSTDFLVQKCRLADRGEWICQSCVSVEEARKRAVAELIWEKWNIFNDAYVWKHKPELAGYSLRKIFSPPKNLLF